MADRGNIFAQIILLTHLSWGIILLKYILLFLYNLFDKIKHLFTKVK